MSKLKSLLTARLAVIFMLVVQVVILLVSLETYYEISIFCTGPESSSLSWTFGLLHFAFIGLLVLGLASLARQAARPFYLILTLVGLSALPVQAVLVHSNVLQCDLP